MAMVLDAFASYIANTIEQMAKDEVGMLLGVRGEIDSLHDKLESLRDYLADAERKRITDRRVQGWVTKLKGVMCEATNILDLCELKAMGWRDASCCNPLLFCLRHPRFAHDIGSRIRKLNKRLDDICKLGAAFSFIKLETYQDYRTGRPSAADRKTDPVLERSAVVGEKIEEDTRALVEKLTKDNDGIMVLAIVGVGGIGKTTLAKKVFNDEEIQHKFEKKMWLSVTQDFSEVELLRSAIDAANGKLPATQDKSMLVPALLNAVRNQKFLLVLDDMWSDRAWTSLLNAPLSHGAPGSRIVITTRNETVARSMRAREPHHRIDKLGPEDAWTLLRKQVVSGEADGPDIDMLKDIGLQVLAKCDGLPLAVKVMGGLLRQKGKQRRDWEMVLNDSLWSVSMREELNYVVYLSYEDLPPPVKQCFLYYSLLPKGSLFFDDAIISMWISEGFIHGTSEDNLEELGREYYMELMLRNLIEPGTEYIDDQASNMHDVVRSFAQFVAGDQAATIQSGETGSASKLTAQQFLHLSIDRKNSESDVLDWSSLQAQKALRTLICVGLVNIKPGDSLVYFSGLRTLILHTHSANVALLVESLHELKLLRYLSIQNCDISCLPENIGKMKFLQYINLCICVQLVKLPHSIVKLGKLWSLDLRGTSINGIPRGFHALKNLRRLRGFPVQVDGDWCSLEELGPLSELRVLGLIGLQNGSATFSAAKARLSKKEYLTNLYLQCSSILWVDGLIKDEEGVSEQQQIKEVFDGLRPPPSLDFFYMEGYFGRQLPTWMASTLLASSLGCLRTLFMEGLPCCTQLPDGLCQLPYLEVLQIHHAPSIKRVGPEFLQPYNHHAFPRLRTMSLDGMLQWEEWVWEEQVQAFPVLEELFLQKCKLRLVPPGLASNARALKMLDISSVQQVKLLENFASVTELQLNHNPDLERITNLPNLEKLTIVNCTKLNVLEGVPALQILVLEDYAMEELPEYIRGIMPRQLQVDCKLWLLASVAAGQSGTEWDKFSHVKHVKAYADDGKNVRGLYVWYTRDPCSLETNINHPFVSAGILSSIDGQVFQSVFKMKISTFHYVCGLVYAPSLEDMSSCTFADGRVLSLQDRVALALFVLNSSEPLEIIGSYVGVNESTISLLTDSFVDAMVEKATDHLHWPYPYEIEKIKSKFHKIHGLPNCCGVLHTVCITPQDHERGYIFVLQAIIDPDLRFIHVDWEWSVGGTRSGIILHDSNLFQSCEKGEWLNGNRLKVSLDGSEVGEYLIGDAEYPLLPWLLTPYNQLENEDHPNFHYQAEFNRRHSAARTVTLKALARLKETYKWLQQGTWSPEDRNTAINACLMLHNIVIDMEEGEGVPYSEDADYSEQVRRLADEDAARARDVLARYCLTSSMSSQS
ncbi:putative disease resistance RPP13-like protein 1 [Hordeum vulgare subsp. vulgare]|uniref:Uncharacterized protein n=1 Tax=Hordeum vulgare subsp. vulgare TaxID=112509 RepID=A0A287VG89_HORVV|nr:putative disease resistance RPP13-like protein 1 [Hordeum vulgare subsp. vulgare]